MISAGFILLLAIGAIWAVIALQKFVTFPRAHHSLQQPAARIAAAGEAIWFDIDGGRVEAWFLPAPGPSPSCGDPPSGPAAFACSQRKPCHAPQHRRRPSQTGRPWENTEKRFYAGAKLEIT